MKERCYDRFIGFSSSRKNTVLSECSTNESNYVFHLRRNLFGLSDNKKTSATHEFTHPSTQIREQYQINELKIKTPKLILDVPNVVDDFYLNCLEWSKDSYISIGLKTTVHIYSKNGIYKLTESPFGSYVSGLKSAENILAASYSNGCVEIFDMEKTAVFRSIKVHENRISAMLFLKDKLYTGSKDKQIAINDLRLRNSIVDKLKGHKGEICTLKNKNDESDMFVSGSNDNSMCVWDVRKDKFIKQLKGHEGAVKGITWLPHKNNIIVSGGGSNDRTLRIWDLNNFEIMAKTQTDAQISSLIWNTKLNCLISAESNHNKNTLELWKIKSENNDAYKLCKKHTIEAHSARVLSVAQSNSNQHFCSISAEETLKVWSATEETALINDYSWL